jgi:hypothetical protein
MSTTKPARPCHRSPMFAMRRPLVGRKEKESPQDSLPECGNALVQTALFAFNSSAQSLSPEGRSLEDCP